MANFEHLDSTTSGSGATRFQERGEWGWNHGGSNRDLAVRVSSISEAERRARSVESGGLKLKEGFGSETVLRGLKGRREAVLVRRGATSVAVLWRLSSDVG